VDLANHRPHVEVARIRWSCLEGGGRDPAAGWEVGSQFGSVWSKESQVSRRSLQCPSSFVGEDVVVVAEKDQVVDAGLALSGVSYPSVVEVEESSLVEVEESTVVEVEDELELDDELDELDGELVLDVDEVGGGGVIGVR